jgi:Zn-dependent M32 family carboxypeptidase
MTRLKVRKLLITAGVYETPISGEVNRLHRQGKTIAEIQEATGLKRASVHSYLPYSKAIYKLEEASVTSERIRKYRSRKQAVEVLKKALETGKHEGIVNSHLLEIDRTASERMERLTEEMAKAEGVTEKLKADNQMLWLHRMCTMDFRKRSHR